MKRIMLLLVLLMAVPNVLADYRNAYMVSWDGTACDNIKYAQNMGYDYVMYQEGMEKCPGPINLKFYWESPDAEIPMWQIFYNREYTQQEIDLYNAWYVHKSNETFPNNLATGWFYGDGSFRPIPNLQKQWIIDELINRSITRANRKVSVSKNFTFGGWSWDVPQLDGDYWSGLQYLEFFPNRANGTGRQVTIAYWTGTCSGIDEGNDYPCFADGKAEFYKQLFRKTREIYPDMKVYLEPYNVWSSYMRDVVSRPDVNELIPDMMCSESTRIDFLTDQRILQYVPTTNMCSDTPDSYTHSSNLKLMGQLAEKGAWFNWFGRIGGTGDFPPLSSMRVVPDRLKLVRAIPGWDNLNGVALQDRSWNGTTYKSTLSYADSDVMYSIHPKNHLLYVVMINQKAIPIKGKLKNVYPADNLFDKEKNILGNEVTANSDWKQEGIYITLTNSNNLGKGYILEISSAETPAVTQQPSGGGGGGGYWTPSPTPTPTINLNKVETLNAPPPNDTTPGTKILTFAKDQAVSHPFIVLAGVLIGIMYIQNRPRRRRSRW